MDPGLTELGLRQAQAVADALLTADDRTRPTRILSSPLRRCRETAAPFSTRGNLPVTVEPAVAEIPTPPGLAAAERAPWLRAAMAGDWSAMRGIDGLAWRRGVVEALLRAGGAAVFTHFVAINAAVTAATGVSCVLACRPAPVSVTVLRVDNGRLHLEALGVELEAAGRVL